MPSDPTQHPDQIGPFRIIERLGAGGMGAVYLAEQSEPVKRRVALKLVHAALRSPEALARFAAERHAMGRLSHPNVAALYEAGATDEGFPYFAMEYIPGQPFTDHCDRQNLAIEERLRLFTQICAGVNHAHQKGIIHRDIKPNNLLVTEVEGQSVPKVIDFGIAKALDEPLTEVAELTGMRAMGTPDYISPEALAGDSDIDTRADVYSLGMVLYELLTGSKPHQSKVLQSSGGEFSATWASAQRPSQRLRGLNRVEAEAVAKCRGLAAHELVARVRGDLDWIVAQAIAAEPERRYGSAAELAADIQRHLHDQPVLARPPSARYRLGKFVRRHRIAAVAAALVVVTLIGGILGTTSGLMQARKAESKARAQAQRADNEALAATQVADFLTDLFNLSDPGEARGNTITARELLARGSTRIRRELADQPLVRARLMGTMSDVYGKLGLYEQAVALEEETLALRKAQLGPEHPQIAVSFDALGDLYYRQARYAEAERAHREALAIRQKTPGSNHLDVAESLNSLATDLFERGTGKEAETLYRQALAIRQQSLGPDHLDVADSKTHLGWLFLNQERYEESEQQLTNAMAIREQALGPDHHLVADNLNLLADLHYKRGEYEQAEALIQRALGIYQQVLDPGHPEIGRSLLTLGTLHRFRNQSEQAEDTVRRAIGVFEKALGPDHEDVARALEELALTLDQLERWQEAEQAYRRQLGIHEKTFGTDHRSVGRVLNNLGYVLSDRLNRREEGEKLLRRSVAIFAAGSDPDNYWNALSRWSLANNLRDQQRYKEAELYFQQALDILEKTGGSSRVDNPNLPELVADYGKLLRATGRVTEAAVLETGAE